MIKFKRPLWALFLCLSIAACSQGENSQTVSSKATAAQTSTQTGNPYYEMADGTYQAYTIQNITAAHWDNSAHELVVDATKDGSVTVPGTTKPNKYLILQTQVAYCESSLPGATLYGNYYSYNNTALPQSVPDPNNVLYDGFFSTSDGNQAFGELASGTLYGSGHGENEPLITPHPVVGEHIHNHAALMGACGDNTPTGVTLDTDYYTVRHYDSIVFSGVTYYDVIETSLIEQEPVPRYYNNYYANQNVNKVGGLIAFNCWMSGANYYNCGNFYIAKPTQ